MSYKILSTGIKRSVIAFVFTDGVVRIEMMMSLKKKRTKLSAFRSASLTNRTRSPSIIFKGKELVLITSAQVALSRLHVRNSRERKAMNGLLSWVLRSHSRALFFIYGPDTQLWPKLVIYLTDDELRQAGGKERKSSGQSLYLSSIPAFAE